MLCETECSRAEREPDLSIGYVYVLSNPSMPGLLKIGMTRRSILDRISELNVTGVPSGFNVEAYFAVRDPDIAEARAHLALNACRVPGKEFFRNTVTEVLATLTDLFGERPRMSKETKKKNVKTEAGAREESVAGVEAQPIPDESITAPSVIDGSRPDSIDQWINSWMGEGITARHRCPENRNAGIAVLRRDPFFKIPGGWSVSLVRFATDDDVRNGIAANIDEVVGDEFFFVSFCPFCGANLVTHGT